MSLTTRQTASEAEEDTSAHFLPSPKSVTPKDMEEGRFLVSNTALEILNGYTKSQEEKKQGLLQVYEKTKLPDVRQSTGRHLLYRYEMNGIVVYDSHARCCDEHNQKTQELQKSLGLSAAVKKEIEGAPDYDKAMYANMPLYPKTKTLPEEYTLVIPLENTLRFDSKFESGNLRKAVKICDDEYILLQDYDVDTKGHTQWFYFSVRNEKAGHKVRFSIVNLMKYDSLYNNGLKPLVLSAKKERWSKVGWHRTCDTVSYYQNNIPRTPSTDTRLPHFYYTLSFTYTFEYDHDLVYFAHCYPYCYSTLQSYISSAVIRSEEEDILRVDSLCTTHTGNTCPVLTITSNVSTYSSWEDEFSLMMKSAAGRKMIRQREERKEAHLKSVEQVRNVKLVQGQTQLGRNRT
jgi:hypothetical protein